MKLKTLFVAAAVSLAAFVANPLLAQCAAGAVKKDIALQLYSLRDMFKKDYESAMKTVGEMGYTAGVRMNAVSTRFGFSNSSGKVKLTAPFFMSFDSQDTPAENFMVRRQRNLRLM